MNKMLKYTVSQIKRGHFIFVITFTGVKLFSKFLKLATSHIFLHLPHLNYATKNKVAPFYLGHGVVRVQANSAGMQMSTNSLPSVGCGVKAKCNVM